MQACGPCGNAPPPDESRASSENMSRRMCTAHTSHHADTSSGGPLMGASPTCSSVCMETCTRGVFRPDGSPPGTIHSLIHTVDKSVCKGSVHRRINVSETAPRRPSQSLELCQRSMYKPCSYTAYTGLNRPHKTGVTAVCQTCARSVRHPVTAADAAWRDTGAKQACHRVLPQSRLTRVNRQALSRVSEAVPPQRPTGQPGVVPPVFPFVTPLCPPYAP